MQSKEKLNAVVQELLILKEERKEKNKVRISHFQQYRKLLGQEQELTRKLNKKLEELEEFRMRI